MQPSLFDNSTLKNHSPNTPNTITEEKIVQPLTQVLEVITPMATNQTQQIAENKSIKQSLDELFPEQQYDEKNIKKAKEILGDTAEALTEEQLRDTVAEIQYLATSWLDEFERERFKGLTLNELLHERGRV